jgi:hypothetical protein
MRNNSTGLDGLRSGCLIKGCDNCPASGVAAWAVLAPKPAKKIAQASERMQGKNGVVMVN